MPAAPNACFAWRSERVRSPVKLSSSAFHWSSCCSVSNATWILLAANLVRSRVDALGRLLNLRLVVHRPPKLALGDLPFLAEGHVDQVLGTVQRLSSQRLELRREQPVGVDLQVPARGSLEGPAEHRFAGPQRVFPSVWPATERQPTHTSLAGVSHYRQHLL